MPEILYHYTDSSGLLGIVNSKILWATDIWFVNDLVEATYGLKRVRRYLDETRPPEGSDEERFVENTKWLLRRLQSQEEGKSPGSFIACLSKNGDQLSQWRGYGRRQGFSIGFERPGLERLAATSDPAFTIREVAYEDGVQGMLISQHYHRIVSALPQPATEENIVGASAEFYLWAAALAPSLKSPAFAEEAEVRLHAFEGAADSFGANLRFRSSAMGLTPYIDLPLCKPDEDRITVMRELIIGPQRYPSEAQRAVSSLLKQNGLDDVQVTVSRVPLREW